MSSSAMSSSAAATPWSAVSLVCSTARESASLADAEGITITDDGSLPATTTTSTFAAAPSSPPSASSSTLGTT